jgi:hypothetical protein
MRQKKWTRDLFLVQNDYNAARDEILIARC